MSDWTWGQWYTVGVEDVGFKTTIMPGENPAGKEQRNSEGAARKVFSFPLKYKNASDRAAIWSFYVTKKGAYGTWTITVDGTEYTVRFRKDGLKFNISKGQFSETSIEAIEVL